jgi:hypothetical protein
MKSLGIIRVVLLDVLGAKMSLKDMTNGRTVGFVY